MGLPQSASPPHLYPQALQLKLYQAFIFSIPILFSIILFLLFYLFYLKRRAATLSPTPPILPRIINQATPLVNPLLCEMGLKGELKDKLPTVVFDEDLRARDSLCCVCLGEYEMKEELLQVPSCRHVFHPDCIRHWLHSNSTCPLCRCSVVADTTKHGHPQLPLPIQPPNLQQDMHIDHSSNHHPQQVSSVGSSRVEMEGSSSTSTCSRVSQEMDQESVVLHIQDHH